MAPSDGYIYCYAQVNGRRVYAYINGAEIFSCMNNNYADGNGSLAPVKKGDSITVSGTVWNVGFVIFYPLKWRKGILKHVDYRRRIK